MIKNFKLSGKLLPHQLANRARADSSFLDPQRAGR